MRLLISSLIVLAFVPVSGNAQVAPSQPVAASAQQPTAEVRLQKSGPTIESAAVGIRPAVTSTVDASAEAQQRRRRSGFDQSVVLMIVGGAAMVAGAIIGDDAGTIFLVGGAVIALYGLYQYLR